MFLALNDIEDRIMRKYTTTAKLTEYEKERNNAISKKRYIAVPCGMGSKSEPGRKKEIVEGTASLLPARRLFHRVRQYFGLSHLHDRGYVARFTTTIKNTLDCMFTQMAFNITRAVKVLGVT